MYEEDCPEGTYVDSFESDNGLGGKRRVEYCAQAYQCCDGTYVKSLLECDYSKCPSTPSVCNVYPGETETQLKYCSGKKFDDSPEVCDWVNITPWPPSCETGKEWSEEHLQVSVKKESFSGGGQRVLRWLSKNVSFKEGACQSGYVNSETPYCIGSTYNLTCNSMNSNSRLKPIRPLKFF